MRKLRDLFILNNFSNLKTDRSLTRAKNNVMENIVKMFFLYIYVITFTLSCNTGDDPDKSNIGNSSKVDVADKVPKEAKSKTTASGLPIVGKLKTRDTAITIISSPNGLLYTVEDQNGNIVIKEALEDELRAKLPDTHKHVKEMIAQKGWAGLDL